MNIAVVTGASSGLGRELITYIDSCGLDEIWVNGRRTERLKVLRQTVKTPVQIFAGDISDIVTIQNVSAALQETKATIEYFIYAAGCGKIGEAGTIPDKSLRQMIQANCTAAVALTEACLPYMAQDSRIAYICSVAAFQPIPYINVYAGTKAFLYHYSRALSVELKKRRISVTAVCPYWIKDTEFIDIARKDEEKLYFKRFPFASTVASVAKEAWQDIEKRKTVSAPGWFAKLNRLGTKLFPAKWIMHLSRMLFG